jgi:hypothetical protein
LQQVLEALAAGVRSTGSSSSSEMQRLAFHIQRELVAYSLAVLLQQQREREPERTHGGDKAAWSKAAS